ncbi:MAG: hypothetical protein A07HR60_00986 [uncultured archaeon A07HR60]|nr:MAG: hypothetical protein A07HR60_00986 [uncultured archaeon A07HR60]
MGERADDIEPNPGTEQGGSETAGPRQTGTGNDDAATDGGTTSGSTDAGPTAPDGPDHRAAGSEDDPRGAPDVAALEAELDRLRANLDTVEADLDERTVARPQLEAELKRYVRRRLRRGHARGWGPYVVLLYGVVLTLGAFRFLDGPWAIAAMGVLFLSTLGLYTLFIFVGVGLNALSAPGKALDFVRDRKD